jgi:hypothetical protein
MNIGELRKIIEGLDDSTEIIMAKDVEGNGYSPLDQCRQWLYVPKSTWAGNVYDPSWSADDACMTDDEWEKIKAKDSVLVLWPIN